MQSIKKMGSMSSILEMIPGLGGMKDARKQIQEAEERGELKRTEAIIRSMTFQERENPDLINPSRKTRIAKGSGTTIQQVNQLLKQFEEMRKMMKTMNKMGGGKRALNTLNPFGR